MSELLDLLGAVEKPKLAVLRWLVEHKFQFVQEFVVRGYPIDFLIGTDNCCVLLQVNEHQHQWRDADLESRQADAILESLYFLHSKNPQYRFLLLRFNPHEYTVGDQRRNPPLRDRLSKLKLYLEQCPIWRASEHQPSDTPVVCGHYCYDTDADGNVLSPVLEVNQALKEISFDIEARPAFVPPQLETPKPADVDPVIKQLRLDLEDKQRQINYLKRKAEQAERILSYLREDSMPPNSPKMAKLAEIEEMEEHHTDGIYPDVKIDGADSYVMNKLVDGVVSRNFTGKVPSNLTNDDLRECLRQQAQAFGLSDRAIESSFKRLGF